MFGAAGSPFAGAAFRVEFAVPTRYPFQPIVLRFAGARVPWHPNVSPDGRVCAGAEDFYGDRGMANPITTMLHILLDLQALLSTPREGGVGNAAAAQQLREGTWAAAAAAAAATA